MDIESIKLDYVGKLHINLVEIGRRINLLTLGLPVLSLVLIGVALRAFPVEDSVELAALKIRVAYPIVLLAGSTIAAVAYVHFLALIVRESHVRDTIIRLYGELNFHERSLEDLEANPLEFPNVVTMTLNSRQATGSRFAMAIWFIWSSSVSLGVLGLPLAAAVVCARQLILEYGWRLWIVVPFTVLLIAVASNTVLVARGWKATAVGA